MSTPRTTRDLIVVGPDARGRATVVRHFSMLACALRRARALADARPGFEVAILEAVAPGYDYPLARVRATAQGRRIDWTCSR